MPARIIHHSAVIQALPPATEGPTMDQGDRYRAIVRRLIEEYANHKPAVGNTRRRRIGAARYQSFGGSTAVRPREPGVPSAWR